MGENKRSSTRSGYCRRMRGLHDKRHLLAKLRIAGSENSEILAKALLLCGGVTITRNSSQIYRFEDKN